MLSALAAAVSLVIPARLADHPLNAARAVRLGAARTIDPPPRPAPRRARSSPLPVTGAPPAG